MNVVNCSIHLVSTLDAALVGSVLAGKQCLSGLISFELGDLAVGWVDWNLNGVATSLISHDLLDVDAPSLSINANDFSVGALASVLGAASKNLDGIAFSDWNRSTVILRSQIFAQLATHNLSLNAAWGSEVSLSRLSSLARDGYSK